MPSPFDLPRPLPGDPPLTTPPPVVIPPRHSFGFFRTLLHCLIPGLLLVGSIRAQELGEADINARIIRTPASARITQTIRFTGGPGGYRYLELGLTHNSGKDLNLVRLELDFPWLHDGSRDLLVSSGGTVMNSWPSLVIDPAQAHSKPPDSGTYLMARHDGAYSLVAFLTWNTFWSKLHYEHGRVEISVDGEGRLVRAGETVKLEKLWLAAGPDWGDLLYSYADEIAREQHITLKPQPHYVGWSTWDYYGRDWTAANVLDNMRAVKALAPSTNLIQIDGGWWPARGDYMLVRDNLQPGGLKELSTRIRAAGLTAGLHFDGMRGDRVSKVAREHPEYFLHDQHGTMISELQPNNAGDRLDSTYFDFSDPGALAYTREVARNIRREWGFDYIKIDFLVHGLNEEIRRRALKNDATRKIVPHNPGLTSVERLRLALKAWREGMGADAYFVACSAPYGPVFGLVDGLRTGPDIFPNFESYRQCSEANSSAFYLQGRVVWNDADYHVVRAKEDEDGTLVKNPRKSGGNLALNEAAMWSNYVGLFGGTKLNSDNLPILRPERKKLFQEAAALPACARYVPLDFWAHGRNPKDSFQVMLGEADGELYLGLFNWTDAVREYRLGGLTPAQLKGLKLRAGAGATSVEGGVLTARVDAHHSAVLQLPAGLGYDATRRAVRVE